jgi:hypothetical protein
MRGIFISYRRDDAEGQAGRLYNDLVRVFGAKSIFMDVVGIDPGMDFRKVIDNSVSSCGILLSVIGPRWLSAENEAGQRRLDDPTDFVRLETIAALKRDIPVIPVLVQDARMPKPDQLPVELRDLVYRNAAALTHARWDSDTAVLITGLRRLIEGAEGGTAKKADEPERPQETAAKPIVAGKKRGRTWRVVKTIFKVIFALLAVIVVANLLGRHH